MLYGTRSEAATFTWTGAGDNNWSNGANWLGGTSPANDGTADLVFGYSIRNEPVVDQAWHVNSLTFGAGRTHHYRLTGSPVTIGAGGVINRNALEYVEIHNDVKLAADQTWEQDATSSSLVFQGNVDLGSRTLTGRSEYPGFGGAGLTLGGSISGEGGNLVLEPGTNISIFGGAHTYTGTTTISKGEGNVHLYVPNPFTPEILNDNHSLIHNVGGDFTHVVSGQGSVDYNGQQTYSLQAANSYAGGTSIGYSIGSSSATSADLVVRAFNDQVFGSGSVGFWYRGGTLEAVDRTTSFDNDLWISMYSMASARFIGSHEMTFNGGLTVYDTVDLGANGMVELYVSAPSLTFAGEVDSSQSGTVRSPLNKTGPGDLIFSGSTSNTFTNDVVVTGGRLILDKDDPISLVAVPGDLRVLEDGVLAGGGAIGGNLLNSGTWEIDISGTQPGEFDAFFVEGGVALGGSKLHVSMASEFMPNNGDSFDIINAAEDGVLCCFVDQELPTLAGDLTWEVDYRQKKVTLRVVGPVLPGDFDLDGDVDGSDFLDWQRNSSIGGLSDWQTTFGTTSSTIADSVPEPSGLIWAGAIFGAAARRRRYRL